MMDETKSILRDIRVSVGLTEETVDFDTDLLMLINASLGVLNQNGVGLPVTVQDETTTWGDFKDPGQVTGNLYYHLVPLYIQLSTKIIFDPPPPSSVQHFSTTIDSLLWRLKVAYEESVVTTTLTEDW